MIYCVEAVAVRAWLEANAFTHVGDTATSEIWADPDGSVLQLRQPNMNGHMVEMLVESAFDAAGIPYPSFHVFWCD